MNTDLDPLGYNYSNQIKSKKAENPNSPQEFVEIIKKTENSSQEDEISFSAENLSLNETMKFAILKNIFPELTRNEQEMIGKRLDQFAIDSEIDSLEMYLKIQSGKKILESIVNNTLPNKTNKTADLVDVDWYFRAQLAKMDKLYLSGALKFPDPDHKFLEFALNTKGTFRGKKESIYSRMSSHWPELQKKISKITFKLPNGDQVCFDKKSAKKLKKSAISGKIHLFQEPNFGIDASTKEGKSLGLPGNNNKTFLVAPLIEENVPMIAIKNETYSSGKVTSFNHMKDSLLHSIQWIKKKGPIQILRSNSIRENYPVRKEDVLPDTLKRKIQLVDLKNPNAKASYKNLIETEQLGSDYSLSALKDHLDVLIIHADSSQKPLIQEALDEINSIFASYKDLSKEWKYQVLPRSQECILPTIQEMLDGKVLFIPNNNPENSTTF